jgi:phosphoglycolate phosphatase-like HAD superfamily hydrolase
VSYFDTIIDYDAITRSATDGKIKQDWNFTEDIEELRKIVPKNLSSFLEKPNFLSTSFALNGLNTSPRATIVFEDSINGLQSCKTCFNSPFGAPVYVVGVTWGFIKDKQKLIDAGADAIMHNITDIEPFIEHLGGFYGERR